MDDLDLARYPIGRFTPPQTPLDADARRKCIDALLLAPTTLRSLVDELTDAELNTPYRTGGWTIRQVVHHVPESHMHSYLRMKFAVTEDSPTIKPYDEERWSQLPDACAAPVALSLDLLEALHRRWVAFLRTLSDQEFSRTFMHPELGVVSIDHVLALYSWHGRHHAAHIEQALVNGLVPGRGPWRSSAES